MTSSVRSSVAPSGSCANPIRYCLSCVGTKPPGTALKSPAVASATGGIPDKVIEGETGFLVQPGDGRALAERIRWMSAHPGERAEMGRRGLRLAEAQFSWARVAARTEELFYELIDEKAACRGQEVAVGSC